MNSKTVIGTLGLDVIQSSCGDNLYIVEIDALTGETMQSITEEYLGRSVKITIEELPLQNDYYRSM